uniref:Uncharacterized protein n=1 Tax=Cacopsylla melanoneura TaxID=428564 RepID=A0A8D9FFS5_9HEMI
MSGTGSTIDFFVVVAGVRVDDAMEVVVGDVLVEVGVRGFWFPNMAGRGFLMVCDSVLTVVVGGVASLLVVVDSASIKVNVASLFAIPAASFSCSTLSIMSTGGRLRRSYFAVVADP